MDNGENLFHPSLTAAIMRLDPEDGEQIMEYFKTHALLSREKALLQASIREQKKLLVENAKLKKDIEQLKIQLQDKQRRRNAKAPPSQSQSSAPAMPVSPPDPENRPPLPPPSSSLEHKEHQTRRRRGERKARPTSDPLALESRVDASRLDLRVGRVLNVRRHPLAEDMSVQEVDVGENEPRTVVGKLGEKSNPEELQGSLAVILCNVKACKLKGVVSQARLLTCSSSDGSIEVLLPPSGATPGDRVTFLSYPGEPDRELQPKQKIWDLLQPHLGVDGRGVANYKGCGFEVKGKGLCRAPTLTDCPIR
ncbi:aminoacyl tRNA synthase complex-interacting multifunctional protein 1 [Pholidichthys leucotaenia]